MLAIDLENRRRANRETTQQNSSESEIIENIGEFVIKQCDEFSYSTEKSGNDVVVDSAAKEKRDHVSMMDNSIHASEGKFSIENTKFEANDSPRSLHLDLNAIATANGTADMLSPSFSLHSSPSMGALNETKNQTLYLTPYSVRDSPEIDFNARKLIRSNSYTLDTPSPMLLKLMEANGINANESAPSKPIASSQPSLCVKQKMPVVKQAWMGTTTKIAVKRSPSMHDVKTNKIFETRKSISPALSVRDQPKKNFTKTTKSTFLQQKSVSARNQESVLRSIYDANFSGRTATKPKKSFTVPVVVSGKSTARIERPAQKPITSPEPNTVDVQKILKMIEEQHNAQMIALMERQREEQKQMQEEFGRQQEMLVKQISHLVLPTMLSNGADVSAESILNKSNLPNNSMNSSKIDSSAGGYDSNDNEDSSMWASKSFDLNGNRLNRNRFNRKHPTPESVKCIRRLEYYDDIQMVSSDLCDSNKQPEHQHIETMPFSSDDEQLYRIQNDAATIITAYAKGYLTRRLFKTVKVQNIVKTIKDTLLFILDIHFENPIENDSPADLKLKTHLIQQVSTAPNFQLKSNTIFFLFFFSYNFPAYVRMLQLT